jgi:Carboxypeptidase regulatory-like domain
MKRLTQITLLLIAVAFSAIFQLSCQKELSQKTEEPAVQQPKAMVKTSVEGFVTDENGQPIASAVIRAAEQTMVTDNNGYFSIKQVSMPEMTGTLTVTKSGYFTGSRTFAAAAGRMHFIRVQLIPQKIAGSFEASSGGSVLLSNGLGISLPANSVVNAATKAAYSGPVRVVAAWLDPTHEKINEMMPGDLRGVRTNGDEQALQTFGMAAVELLGSSGEKLQVASGKMASLSIPLPASLSGSAPASIPLWHYDEASGMWKEEGSAVKTGNSYKGQVSHFSFWNCDYPMDEAHFSATLVSSDNQPLSNATVRISTASRGYGYGYTNSEGQVSGFVPTREALTLELLNPCGQVAWTRSLGILSSNTDLGRVTVSSPGHFIATITGVAVNCSNQPIASGKVFVRSGSSFNAADIVNGNFRISVISCGNNPVDIKAFDPATLQEGGSSTYALRSGANDIGRLMACGAATGEYIVFSVDGSLPSALSSADSIKVAFADNTTTLYAYSITNNNHYINFSLQPSTPLPGTYPLTALNISSGTANGNGNMTIINPLNVAVTEYGLPGEYFTGSFSGVVRENQQNINRTVQVNFRVKRDQ